MKFENPIMNISMFAAENVVTVSGDKPIETKSAAEAAQTYLADTSETLKYTF